VKIVVPICGNFDSRSVGDIIIFKGSQLVLEVNTIAKE
jgi:hypothetical protein